MDQLQGESEALYIKCLFRTINFLELKSQLLLRGFALNSDSYYTMTLKLRLHILETDNCYKDIQTEIKAELTLVRKQPKGYNCSISGCHYSSTNYKFLLKHIRTLHGTSKHHLVCQLNGCTRVLSSLNMLSLHFRTSHQPGKLSSVSLKQNQLTEEFSRLKCLESSCSHQKFKTVRDLKIHITSVHTDKMQEVECIFCGCSFRADRTGTLRSHFSRKHPIQQVHNLKSDVVENVDGPECQEFSTVDQMETTESLRSEMGTNLNIDMAESLDCDESEEDAECENDSQLLFTKALCIQFNNWSNVLNIAYTTVNLIVSEVFNSYQQGVEVTKNKIANLMRGDGMTADEIKKILDRMDIKDPFSVARSEIENEVNRKKFITNEFAYAAPISVRLNTDDMREKPETLQYIPIKETLKILLEDETFLSQKNSDPYFHEDDVVKDCRDGLNFRQNEFFKQNPTAVPLLLFQDELEVANPLGSGKTKHKIQCTYFTTLEIVPALRSKVKSIQLCSLVLSRHWKKHGNSKCNRNLLEDLKVLETDGLEVNKPVKKVLKVGLAMIVGDNLGQHMLSEMNCCFSSGYICRVCNATYSDVCRNHLLYSNIEDDYKTDFLTKEKYDACADLALENGSSSAETLGIKSHCVFNELRSFHCVDQTPPCLGHDYYEGVFSYDVQHYLDFLINKEKLISIEDFNKKIKNVKLSARDAKNRPKNFKKGAKKYEGNAGSLRVLSRILTLILSPILEKSVTEKFLIKLHEVGEIITAPVLSVFDIEVTMSQIISEYLDLRVEGVETLGMSNPRPKHHFLSHYHRSFRNTGPLINIWAMRMESKHTYMKNVIRAAKNFKNVPLTCANRHQLAQISYCYFGLFSVNKIEVPDTAPDASVVAKVTIDPMLKEYISSLDPKALVPKYVKIFDTQYQAGKVVVLKKLSHGLLKIGLIRSLSFNGKVVNFCLTTFEASQSKFGFYVTTKYLSSFEAVDFDNLLDYYPLEIVGTTESFSFILHHFVSSTSSGF